MSHPTVHRRLTQSSDALRVQQRVHVSPVGFYVERVIAALKFGSAEKVFLLAMEPERDLAARYRDRIVELLCEWKPDIPIHTVTVNIFDINEVTEAICSIIKSESEAGNSVFFNLSPGSHIESTAGAIACMAWGAKAYYVHVRQYSQGLTPIVSEERGELREIGFDVESCQMIPLYAMPKPSKEQLQLLDCLRGHSKTKKALVEELIRRGIVPNGEPIAAKHYGRLASLLSPLQEEPSKVSMTNEDRRAAEVRLTELGELTLRIYQPRPPRTTQLNPPHKA